MKVKVAALIGLLLGAITTGIFVDGSAHQSKAVTTEYVVLDPVTGIAIFGYDPVAYFVDQQAIIGNTDFEVTWQDAQWNFISAANADRFREAPEFYAPQFNGYGAMALADGKTTEGNPLIWAIYKNRLYFFYSTEDRAKWVANVGANVEAARANWSHLSNLLSR